MGNCCAGSKAKKSIGSPRDEREEGEAPSRPSPVLQTPPIWQSTASVLESHLRCPECELYLCHIKTQPTEAQHDTLQCFLHHCQNKHSPRLELSYERSPSDTFLRTTYQAAKTLVALYISTARKAIDKDDEIRKVTLIYVLKFLMSSSSKVETDLIYHFAVLYFIDDSNKEMSTLLQEITGGAFKAVTDGGCAAVKAKKIIEDIINAADDNFFTPFLKLDVPESETNADKPPVDARVIIIRNELIELMRSCQIIYGANINRNQKEIFAETILGPNIIINLAHMRPLSCEDIDIARYVMVYAHQLVDLKRKTCSCFLKSTSREFSIEPTAPEAGVDFCYSMFGLTREEMSDIIEYMSPDLAKTVLSADSWRDLPALGKHLKEAAHEYKDLRKSRCCGMHSGKRRQFCGSSLSAEEVLKMQEMEKYVLLVLQDLKPK